MWCSSFMYRPPEEMRSPGNRGAVATKSKAPEVPKGPSLGSKVATWGRNAAQQAGTALKRRFRSLPARMEVARDEATSVRELLDLVHDPSPLVRMEIAWNRSSTYSILNILRNDKDSDVATVARRRLMALTGFDQ